MDIFTQITQFWLAVVDILWNINDVLVNTTERLDQVNFQNSTFSDYLGYVKYVMGTPLYTIFMSAIVISIGISVYKTFMKGIFLVKELLIKLP